MRRKRTWPFVREQEVSDPDEPQKPIESPKEPEDRLLGEDDGRRALFAEWFGQYGDESSPEQTAWSDEPDAADLYAYDGRSVVRRDFPTLSVLGVVCVIGLALVAHQAFKPTPSHRRTEALALASLGTQGEAKPVQAEAPTIDGFLSSEEANYSGDAQPLPIGRKGDWLHVHKEKGQTFRQYVASHTPLPEERHVLYVVQLGYAPAQADAVFDELEEYVGAFYNVPVRRLPLQNLPIDAYEPARQQYDAQKILKALESSLPRDAIGLLAMSDADLYAESAKWVFGLASPRRRTAVFSMYRFGTDYSLNGFPTSVLSLSMITATHEVGHLLDMRHCTDFHCLMNGSNSLEEAALHPLSLCPVCLKKAEHAIGFERKHRYERLNTFYTKFDFHTEKAFVRRRLHHLTALEPTASEAELP